MCCLMVRLARSFGMMILLLIFVVALSSETAIGATIQWRVENPFRLFASPRSTELHRTTCARLTSEEQRTPILSAERRLNSFYPRGWAELLVADACWSDRRQAYACSRYDDYANPDAHSVIASLELVTPSTALCTWRMTLLRSDDRGRGQDTTLPCNAPVVLDVPYPDGLAVSVAMEGAIIATTDISVTDILIVGIGDSYAAGDGNPDVPVRFDDHRALNYSSPGDLNLQGYPARVGIWTSIADAGFQQSAAGWLSSPCHRSLYGHQLRAALQLAVEDPHRAVTFASFACWGADIINGIFLPSSSSIVVPDLPKRSQLAMVSALQCGRQPTQAKRWPRMFDQGGKLPALGDLDGVVCPVRQARKIDLLLITVGGNDIGFAQLVANAVLTDREPLRKVGALLGQIASPREARAMFPQLGERFKALNRAAHAVLHIPWSEADRIVLTAYPPISLQGVAGQNCPGGQQGMTVNPGFALDARLAEQNERVAVELHAAMRAIARRQGWTLADAHRSTFVSHGLCAGTTQGLASQEDDPRLPRLNGGAWHPFPPSQWQPYASRKRWIRTPNDGYLTVNFHVGKLADDGINLILASTYSGGFHPTAEGQAAIADAVAGKARAVLARYAATDACGRAAQDDVCRELRQ
jgi:hypothetical protein